MNGVDNGWMKFTNVRIPRENLLNRFADVLPDGTYTSPIKSDGKHMPIWCYMSVTITQSFLNKLYVVPVSFVQTVKRFGRQLAALTIGRCGLITASASMLSLALTIAIRFASARKQFGPPGEPEQRMLHFTFCLYSRSNRVPTVNSYFGLYITPTSLDAYVG